VGAPVFKIGGRRRKAGCGGFDSHAFPQKIDDLRFLIDDLRNSIVYK